MYKYNLGTSFEEIVRQYPSNTALRFSKSESYSYDELNKKANQIARYLKNSGIRANDVVCISGDKRFSTFFCMIACLKIGSAYAILDPESPADRLRKIITRCTPRVLFINSDLTKKLQEITKQINIASINNESKDIEEKIKLFEDINLEETREITGSNSAYIMFTSGSTGFPKGALMTHNNVLNFIDWSIETYTITPKDIFTNVNPLYFDNSVFDFYSSLFSGACMVPFSKEVVTDPKSLVNLIDELKCTLWFSVPTLLIFLQTMKALNKDNMKFIKRIIFGGEGYPKAKLKKIYDLYSDRAEIYNVYGPTECTCICSSCKITSEDFKDLQGFPSLGQMINNFSYLILAEDNSRVKDNEVGELCLLGPNVGKGYYNDPERTQINFVQNPFNDKYTEMMYKTGDLVRYNSEDGKIYVAGRKDNQIKHMGYRIEMEEIETALSSLDYIDQAAVLHGNSRGLSQIIAVINSKALINKTNIGNDLRQFIPNYMIPTVFHITDKELPKNPNGKVDRRKLSEIYLKDH